MRRNALRTAGDTVRQSVPLCMGLVGLGFALWVGWVVALCGDAMGAESRIENERISVSWQAGATGLSLGSKKTENKLELRLLDEKDAVAAIKSATASALEGDESRSLKVVTDAGEALVTLKTGQPFVEIKPGKGLKGVALVMPSRFAVMPDFFAMDVVLDARHLKQDKVAALADNFYLMPIDGGSGMVFCVWPGADPKEQTREESAVELVATGAGEARRFTESRAFFPGSKPVYVALLEGGSYWALESAASWEAGKAVKSEWKRPFDARWRVSFLTKEGKIVSNWGVSILSAYFPELRKGRNGWFHDEFVNSGLGWTGRYGEGPEGAAMGMGHYAHPCWFKDKDTYLYPYVSPAEINAAADYNRMEKALAEKAKRDGRPYTIYTHTTENIYESAIIYPIQRSKDTPLDVMTPADIMRETLGVGPCEYILDKEGAVWAFHGGQKKMHFEGATCGNWDGRLGPLLNEWKAKGGALDAEKKQNVVWLIEDMGTFIAAVNLRIHAYDDCLKKVKALCEEAKQKGSKEDAALAAALAEQINAMQRTLSNVAGFDKGLAQWQDTLAKMMEVAKGADTFKPELMQVGNVRGFADPQDSTIAGCRRCVNMIKQRAGLAVSESGAGSASLAAKIREECRKVLRNPHPLEHF